MAVSTSTTTTASTGATSSSGSAVVQSLSASPYTITGLTAATSYTINLVANNNGGSSSPSNSVSITTSAATPALNLTIIEAQPLVSASSSTQWNNIVN